jgi:hypothetical protein
MNPAPDADLHSVGQENFAWIVQAVADLAVSKAKAARPKVPEFHWSVYLSGGGAKKAPAKKTAAKRSAKKSGAERDAVDTATAAE